MYVPKIFRLSSCYGVMLSLLLFWFANYYQNSPDVYQNITKVKD